MAIPRANFQFRTLSMCRACWFVTHVTMATDHDDLIQVRKWYQINAKKFPRGIFSLDPRIKQEYYWIKKENMHFSVSSARFLLLLFIIFTSFIQKKISTGFYKKKSIFNLYLNFLFLLYMFCFECPNNEDYHFLCIGLFILGGKVKREVVLFVIHIMIFNIFI